MLFFSTKFDTQLFIISYRKRQSCWQFDLPLYCCLVFIRITFDEDVTRDKQSDSCFSCRPNSLLLIYHFLLLSSSCVLCPLSFISSLTYQKMKNKKNLISSLIYPLSPVISSQIKDFIFSLTTVRGIQIQRKVILRSAWSFFPTYLNWTHTALFLKNNFYQP